jgi:hypothetical protein
VAFHAETSPIAPVGDEILGLHTCSNPSCIKDDLAPLVLELDEKIVAGFRRGIHCQVEMIRSGGFRMCNYTGLRRVWHLDPFLIKRCRWAPCDGSRPFPDLRSGHWTDL